MHFEEEQTVCFRLDGDELAVTRQRSNWTVRWRGDTASGEQIAHALATLTLQTRSSATACASRVLRAKPGAEVGPI
jgi:hypothetical protein